MAGLDIPFTAISIDADETYPTSLQAGDIPLYISRAKARACEAQLTSDDLLITADTIVWVDDHMLGKPHDDVQAKLVRLPLSSFREGRGIRGTRVYRVYRSNEDGRLLFQCDGFSYRSSVRTASTLSLELKAERDLNAITSPSG